MRHDVDARVILGGTAPAAVRDAVIRLPASLDGTGPALAPRTPRPGAHPSPGTGPVPAGTAVVLETSGSTGRPREVALGASALLASARATHHRLDGPGRWLLALPIHHVAGWQVLVRAYLSAVHGLDAPLTVLDTTGGFHAAAFAAAVAALPDDAPRYTALVPTQLSRVLAGPDAALVLARLDAVLVGGAATPPHLLRRARDAGARVLTTYGSTETSGGCVYDGTPLDGVRVAVVGGRLEVSGSTLALGYVDATPGTGPDHDAPDDAAARFLWREGRRWLRTSDLGSIDAAGRVEVLGRADDVVVTGGEKVHPGPVEHVLAQHPGIAEAVVVGLADPEWGAVVTAVVVPAAGCAPPDLAELRALVAEQLGPAHAPRSVVVVDRLPRRGPGKVDRRGAAAMAAGILAEPLRD